MAEQGYFGYVKFMTEDISHPDFKPAKVSFTVEDDIPHLFIRLLCNPKKIDKSRRISGVQAAVKGKRVVVRCRPSDKYWELHFIGQGNREEINKRFCADVMKMSKAGRKDPLNRAEVGRQKNMANLSPDGLLDSANDKRQSTSRGERLYHTFSTTGKQLIHTPRNKQPSQKSVPPMTNQTSHKHIHTKGSQTSTLGNVTSAFSGEQQCPGLSADKPASLSAFTRMKENHHSNESRISSDDESKENQHRGPVNQNIDKQNRQGDRKPLQLSSSFFYGSTAQDKLTSTGTVPGFKPKFRPTIGTPVNKNNLFPKLMKTVSTNTKTIRIAVEKKQPLEIEGFTNIGNTCYMNAVLQALFSLDTFSIDLHSLYKQQHRDLTDDSLAVALTKLMTSKQRPQNNGAQKMLSLLENVKKVISNAVKDFSGYRQQDAHEFLCQVMDLLKEEVKKVSKEKKDASDDQDPRNAYQSHNPAATPPSSNRFSSFYNCFTPDDKMVSSPAPPINPISSNFESEIIKTVRCLSCQEQVLGSEEINIISLDIPSDEKKFPGDHLSLQDVLDMYFEKEAVLHRCEKCEHEKAEVSHRFSRLPRVLVLHLKRYHNGGTKMQVNIQVPRYITLKDFCDGTTEPYRPYTLIRLGSEPSPLKSPVRLPGATFGQRRPPHSRPSNSENSAFPTKKVRRSILIEDLDESPQTSEEINLEKKFEEDLLTALALSRNETSGSPDNNNAQTWQQDSFPSYERVNGMSEEEQIQLAIRHSLESSSPAHMVPTSANPENATGSNGHIDHDPAVHYSTFRTSQFPHQKDHQDYREDFRVLADEGRNQSTVMSDFESSRVNLDLLGFKNFTSANDFIHDADIRQTTPDSMCDSTDQMYTSHRQSGDKIKTAVSDSTSSSFVSTNIGSMGALSKSSTAARTLDGDVDSLYDMKTVEEEHRARYIKENSPHCVRRDSPHSLSYKWAAKEAATLSGAAMEYPMGLSNLGEEQEREEKENRSPLIESKYQSKTEVVMDKETEAKLQQRMLRQTEIEKGNLPHTYRLVSVVNHYGSSSKWGHYKSDVYDFEQGTWYCYDDQNVMKITEAYVRSACTGTGYVFFFLHKDIFDDFDSLRPDGTR